MMKPTFRTACAAIALAVAVSTAQVVVFNDPVAWVTQRSDTIIAKVQLDTAQIKSKEVSMTLTSVKNGAKKVIGTKKFKTDDVSKEYNLGTTGDLMLGGTDYLRIDWTITGTKDKGECVPVGVVNVNRIAWDTIASTRAEGKFDEASLAPVIEKLTFSKIGNAEAAFVWNEKEIGIVIKKGDAADAVLAFGFDGKNGKNGYLAYSDRFIRYYAKSDSVAGVHYERQFVDGKISYNEKKWDADLSAAVGQKYAVIAIKWSDLEMLPLTDPKTTVNGRLTGFAAFSLDAKGNAVAALPAKAKFNMPGTWCDILFRL